MTEPRHILITGATRGLGRSLALRFAELGHRVAACGRNESALRSLSTELGAGHSTHSLDVRDPVAVSDWAAKLRHDDWIPDLLLNNAGVFNRKAPLWELEPEEVERVLATNVLGVVHVIQAFLPAMIEQGRGIVVNLSSGWGQTTAPEVAPYCASKFAIEGLTKAMAQELPAGMAAIPLSPGIIHTEMLDTAFGAEAESFWKPEEWIDTAAPFILRLDASDNGRSVRIPGS